jgi:hypothetical protein
MNANTMGQTDYFNGTPHFASPPTSPWTDWAEKFEAMSDGGNGATSADNASKVAPVDTNCPCRDAIMDCFNG